MTPLLNDNSKLYKVYSISRLFIMTVGHMATKWESGPPRNNRNMQFLAVIGKGK